MEPRLGGAGAERNIIPSIRGSRRPVADIKSEPRSGPSNGAPSDCRRRLRFEPNSADPSRSFPRAANPSCRHRKALSLCFGLSISWSGKRNFAAPGRLTRSPRPKSPRLAQQGRQSLTCQPLRLGDLSRGHLGGEFVAIQQPGHFDARDALSHRTRLRAPDLRGVFRDRAVAGEFPRARDIENALLSPIVRRAIEFGHSLVGLKIGAQVGQVHVVIAVGEQRAPLLAPRLASADCAASRALARLAATPSAPACCASISRLTSPQTSSIHWPAFCPEN